MNEVNLRNLFSRNIKKYRQMKGWSQEKLAERMDISTNYLSEIETGKGWVSPFSLVKLANALEIEIFQLFTPHETVPVDTKKKISKYLNDFSTSMRVSFEKSLNDSMRKIQKHL